MVAWYGQGRIVDRSKEHLGGSDILIAAYRRLLREQIAAVETGQEPMNIFRDPACAESPELRIPGNEGPSPNFVSSDMGPTSVYRANYHKKSPGGWLYIEDDVDRYCTDREQVLDLYRRVEAAMLERNERRVREEAES
jgi:hypothetical protein